MQARLHFRGVTLHLDLKVFADSHVAHFRHSEVLHRFAHRRALWIEDCRFRRDHHMHFHACNMTRAVCGTSEFARCDATLVRA